MPDRQSEPRASSRAVFARQLLRILIRAHETSYRRKRLCQRSLRPEAGSEARHPVQSIQAENSKENPPAPHRRGRKKTDSGNVRCASCPVEIWPSKLLLDQNSFAVNPEIPICHAPQKKS